MIARFERFVERLMERGFTRATGSRLQPVEISKRVIRAMEDRPSVGASGIPVVPNAYDVYLSREDYADFEATRRALARDIEAQLLRTVRQRQFRMMARPVVTLWDDERLQPGEIRVAPRLLDTESTGDIQQHTSLLPRMDGPIVTGPVTPNIVWQGRPYAILHSPTRMGRLADNDIVLNDKRVSRHHAEVLDHGGRWVLRDSGSTNGTAINGKVVREAVLRPGDCISLGGVEVTWEQ